MPQFKQRNSHASSCSRYNSVLETCSYVLTCVPLRSSIQSSITVNLRPLVIASRHCTQSNRLRSHKLALKLEVTGFSIEDLIAVSFDVLHDTTRDTLRRYRTAWNYSCQWLRKSWIFPST